jgi:hypothetical protein
MANPRRGRKQRSTFWTWISFIVFALIIALLGASIYRKETPAAVLKSLIPDKKELGTLSDMSKNELIGYANKQDSIINTLTEKLNQYSYDYVLKLGTIDVEDSTLNLRREATTDAEVIIRIPDSSLVILLYYANETDTIAGESGRWCKVKYGNTEGWVWGKYVIIKED